MVSSKSMMSLSICSTQVSSRHTMTLPVYFSKICRLWVTITIAVPFSLLMPVRSCMMPSAVSVSRFPVGSSAMITLGSLRSERAIAIRCCSPPDNWCGILCALRSIPTAVNTSWMRFSIICSDFHPVARSTKSRFSCTVLSIRSWKSWKTTPILRRRYGISFSLMPFRLYPQTVP